MFLVYVVDDFDVKRVKKPQGATPAKLEVTASRRLAHMNTHQRIFLWKVDARHD